MNRVNATHSGSALAFALSAFLVATVLDSKFAQAQVDGADTRSEVRSVAAQDDVPTIFDVRKSLPMDPSERSYHDFYINAGSEAGFRRGQYLPVQRALPVHDPIQNKQQAIMTVPVGKVLVIHVDRGLTVARLVQEQSEDERPTLEYEAIMIGDRIDMKGITTVAPKSGGKKRGEKGTVEATDVAAKSFEDSSPASLGPKADAEKEALNASSVAVGVQTLPAKSSGDSKPSPSTVKSGATDSGSAPQRVTQPVPPPTA